MCLLLAGLTSLLPTAVTWLFWSACRTQPHTTWKIYCFSSLCMDIQACQRSIDSECYLYEQPIAVFPVDPSACSCLTLFMPCWLSLKVAFCSRHSGSYCILIFLESNSWSICFPFVVLFIPSPHRSWGHYTIAVVTHWFSSLRSKPQWNSQTLSLSLSIFF